MSKFGLDPYVYDAKRHKELLEILARSGPEGDELAKEIDQFVPPAHHINFMYPHTMRTLPK